MGKGINLIIKKDEADATPISKYASQEIKLPMNSTQAVININVFEYKMDYDEYKMDHLLRGKAVIFNHKTFDESKHLHSRVGTEVDVEALKKTFALLDFEVEVHTDLRRDEVISTLKKLKKEDHSDRDCLAVIVLSHGTFDDGIFAYDRAYHTEELWKRFTPDKSPTLAGKPKLFFIQACNGSNSDKGITLTRGGFNSELDCHRAYTIPIFSDLLIGRCSYQGYVSFRNPIHGSWYIQSLCNVLQNDYQSTDLLKMLTKASRKVATKFVFESNHFAFDSLKQMPTVHSTLIRDVYFRPKVSSGIKVSSD